MSSRLIPTLLFDLALIIALAQLLGAAARRIGQPAVIGEILAGILVGPTLFDGAIAGTVFPVDVRPSLGALANLGVAVFMFIVGLELDRSLLRDQGRIVASVSLGSMLLPFALGTLAALYLIQQHPSPHRLGFVLFIGAALSVTAFPVLARILTDRGMLGTPLGGLSLTCAAVDDVLAWALLAIVVALTGGGPDQWRMLLAAPYLVLMLFVVRPLLRRLASRYAGRELTLGVLGLVFAGLLVSAGLTEWMGMHFIFGAFLFGVAMPRAEAAALRQQVVERVGQVCSVLLLPVFFVVGGLNVDLSTMDGTALGELSLILVTAIGGKFAGTFLAARAHGIPNRQSAVLGTLINTRGLTELIILAVGLQLGVLDRPLYTLLVIMAVLTTAMTGPILSLIHPDTQTPAAALNPRSSRT